MATITEYTDTQKLIYSMLTQNTGSHFLDSGGAYGRHWERNQKKTIDDFNNELPQSFEFDKKHKEITRTVSVFHYLSELDTDYLCDIINKIQSKCKEWDSDSEVYGLSSKAWDYLTERYEVEVQYTFNTYNSESDLSQVLQGSHLLINNETYLFLQIHNGCDVRGGYTDAYLFKTDDGLINSYLQEFIYSDEIVQELEYIDEPITDYYDESITYTSKEVINLLNN